MKAITPVISALILLLIAIAVVSTAYYFIFGQYSTYTGKLFDYVIGGSYCKNGDVSIMIRNVGIGNIMLGGTTAIDNRGLIGLWHLNEGSGSMAIDSSGNGNNGNVINAAWEISCVSDSCLNFSGGGETGSRINIPNSASLSTIKTGLTVAYWVNRYENDGGYHILKQDAFGGLKDTGSCSSGTKYHFWTYHETTGHDDMQICTDNMALNEWHHIAITWAPGEKKIYIDGIESASSTASAMDLSISNKPLLLGNSGTWHGYGYKSFIGLLDEIYVYNRTLSRTEIQQLYCFDAGKLGSAPSFCKPSCTIFGNMMNCGDLIIVKTSGDFHNPSFSNPVIKPKETVVFTDKCMQRKCSYKMISPSIGKDIVVNCGFI